MEEAEKRRAEIARYEEEAIAHAHMVEAKRREEMVMERREAMQRMEELA